MMTPEERVWATLNHEEPDRVPIYEAQIEIPELLRGRPPLSIRPGISFISIDAMKVLTKGYVRPLIGPAFKLLKKPQLIQPFVKYSVLKATEVHRELGVDLMSFVGGLPMIFSERVFSDFRVKGNSLFGPHGNLVAQVPDLYDGSAIRNGFLTGPEDYEKYIELQPDHPANYAIIDKALEATRGKIALAINVIGSAFFETMCDFFGFEVLFKLLIRERNFIKKVVKDLNDYALEVAKVMLDKGVKIFYMSDDLGQKRRGLISPRMYKQFFHEGIKKFSNLVHSYDAKIFRHSCGYFEEFIDLFIEERIDAVHPWQSTAGMDIFEGKKKYGDKLTLVGNVPIELLRSGTHKDVIDYVKKLIHICAPGGGYIISSSHSLLRPCKWDNYMAMQWAVRKYGTYPIKEGIF